MSENNMVSAPMDDDLSGRYLTYYIDDALYGVELMMVTEIISIQPITRIPCLPDDVKGVINLRGKILPVVDARLKLKKEPKAYDNLTCITVMTVDGYQVGLIVDRVDQVITIEPEQLTKPQDLGNQLLVSIADFEGRNVLNLDYNKLFANASA